MNRSESLFAILSERFGSRFSTSLALREQNSRGEAYHALALPDAVVRVRTTEEVVEVVRHCRDYGVPMIAHGAGTSLEGQLSAVNGGISIDLSEMNKVLRVNHNDLDCTVEAGVTREELNRYLRDQGLFFPIDPGANATIGGMAATRASGTNAVRYGTMRDVVLALKVVLPDGNTITTSSRARKSAAGYDITRLFVGAEGTLGIITEITIRLFGIPQAISAAVCGFASVESAVDAAAAVVQYGIPVARMELMDRSLIEMTNRQFGLNLPLVDTLAFEFHGSDQAVRDQAEAVSEIVSDFNAVNFTVAIDAAERSKLWHARHNAFYTVTNQRKNARGWSSDVCVPISELAGCIQYGRKLLSDCPVPAAILGHVGDGNFHVVFSIDPDNSSEMQAVKKINAALVSHAISVGGTCTGEHGVGTGKIGYMREEYDDAALALMATLKRAIDPGNLMNPGKILSASAFESLMGTGRVDHLRR